MAKTLKKGITPVGEALYPRLSTPDTYNGAVVGYTIQLKLSEKDTTILLDEIKKEWERACAEDDGIKGKNPKKGTLPYLGYREEEDGSIIFRFKTKHEFEKDGEVIKRVVPIFDSKGNKIEANIGNGSKVCIAYSMNPYFTSTTNYGVTLYLDAVQVIELVEYSGGGTAEGFGFNVIKDDEIPF